jgi:hypothetical protein
MLLNTATIRRDTIELMQNAASTASAAEYPSKSIADIAVEFLCVLCGSRSAQSAGLSDRMTCQTQPFDHPRIFAVADGLLSRLDTLDSAGPAESVSQTQPKTGAGLASCDVTTRIERLGGFGCMRSGDGQSACQYLESNADQRAAQLSTAPANARIRCGNDCANGIDDPSHLKPLSGACRKASGQASAAVAQTPGSPRYSVLPKTVAAFRRFAPRQPGITRGHLNVAWFRLKPASGIGRVHRSEVAGIDSRGEGGCQDRDDQRGGKQPDRPEDLDVMRLLRLSNRRYEGMSQYVNHRAPPLFFGLPG